MEIRMNKHNLSIFNFKDTRKTGRVNWETFFFFGKLSCVFLCLSFLFGKVIMPQYSYNYNASLQDKMRRLVSVEGPKIVLIGNSNLAFGINSEMLENALGMPVVNMGLHGGLGNAFHEEMAKINVQQGDIIIIAHTEFADDDSISDPVLAWLTIENNRNLWKLIRTKDIPDMFFSYPDYAKKALTLWTAREGNKADYGTVYDRSAFNEYGDVRFARPETILEAGFFDENPILVPEINQTCTKRLNKLNEYVKQKGAVLLTAAYPIPAGKNTPPAEDYIRFQKQLSEVLDFPVISDYTDYFLDYHYFYDTAGHLTDEGAILRTNQLILDLQRFLGSVPDSIQKNNLPSS